MKMIKALSLTLLVLFSQSLFAQPTTSMADNMRSDGRIYVVIAVLLTILAGIFLYLVRMEKKIKSLEKE